MSILVEAVEAQYLHKIKILEDLLRDVLKSAEQEADTSVVDWTLVRRIEAEIKKP